MTGSVGGVAASGLTIGKQVEEIAEEDVIDGIIRDVDVLSSGITKRELELLQEPQETSINGVDTVVSIYHLSYVGQKYKLGLITGESEELIDYDFENKQFISKSDDYQIMYKPEEQTLIIVGKQFDKVLIEYIKERFGLGAAIGGSDLTNKKILTAKAVKTLIDKSNSSMTAEIQSLKQRIEALETKCANFQ